MGNDTSRYPDFVFVACDYDMGAQTYDLAVSMEAGSLVGSPVKYVRHDITRPTAEHGELDTVGEVSSVNHTQAAFAGYILSHKLQPGNLLVTRESAERVIAGLRGRISDLEKELEEERCWSTAYYEQEQEVRERAFDLENQLVEKDARIAELDAEIAEHIEARKTLAGYAKAFEAKLAAAEKDAATWETNFKALNAKYARALLNKEAKS